MSLSRSAALLSVMLLFFLVTPCLAQSPAQQERKAELERVLEKLREKAEDKTSTAGLTFPEDTSQRFLVKELRIGGNGLISTAKLLENLPLVYTLPVQKDDTTVEQIYDFRVLHDVILNPGQEREVSINTIQGFTKYVLSVYQNEGYSGIYVYIPAAAVRGTELVDKTLPIEVLEGKLAKIAVERYDFERQTVDKGFLKDSVLQSWSPLKEGEAIQKNKLDDFVRLLNLNPDRYVSAVISRSAEPNALNLTYDVYEANPWHWYAQVDNSGTEERQWSPRVGVTNTNLTGMDDRFSAMYQAPWESGIDENYALFGSYDLPVFTPRLRLNFYGGYSEFDITPQGGPFNFLGRGSFYGSVLSYNVFQIDKWFVDVTGSLSRENSKVTPVLGLASDVDMDLWSVGVNIHRSDEMSNTSLTLSRVESMGGSSTNDFAAARLNADPDFAIYNLGASHGQYLETSKVNRVSGSFRWIKSNERLVPAKMTTFGGFYSVRGYEEDEIVADGGMLMSGQYEFDLIKHSESIENREANSDQTQDNKPWLRKLAPLAFVDFGRAKIKSPVIGEREVRELCSIGVGTIIEIEDKFSAGIYYGWPLRGTDETDNGDGRLHFSCIYRF
ncbi:MAG: ShlB/FhaC/HecB family hemolysin secretion/activation protein [Sedimentisphaerales bacterium]|nr:ShlB/FhaC/HecB family hemolysin secretion/activation protein [Sedimentisphaerales bacterium]